jgi:tetratricopeptide (TPR) repeat protein
MSILIASCLLTSPARSSQQPAAQGGQTAATARENAYRANNVGVAMLEQFKYKEGGDQFRRALQLDPSLAIARVNLAIALFNIPDVENALREAKAAAALLPNNPQPHYIIGLIAKAQNRTEDAIAAFQRVLQIDPRDVGANINLGQIYNGKARYAEAIAVLRVALDAEPYSATATYQLSLSLNRGGRPKRVGE